MKIISRYSNLENQIKEKGNIVWYLKDIANITKISNTYFGDCTNPECGPGTVMFNSDVQKYQCLCCNRGGNIITYIADKYHMTYNESIDFLAKQLQLSDESLQDEAIRKLKSQEVIYKVNSAALSYFKGELYHGKNCGMRYLTETRHLSNDIIKQNQLGFASGDIIGDLLSQGFTPEDLITAGLAKYSDYNGKHELRCIFWNRVIFPIFDTSNRCVGFGGRIINEINKDGSKNKAPKYLNTPETEVFNKSALLYGLNNVIKANKTSLVLCEGYMDAITMNSAGVLAIASLGTALTPYHAQIIKDHVTTVYLAYDADDAGRKAGARNEQILKAAGVHLKYLDFSPAKDGDEFVKTYGAEALKQRIKQASIKSPFEQGQKTEDVNEKKEALNIPEGIR